MFKYHARSDKYIHIDVGIIPIELQVDRINYSGSEIFYVIEKTHGPFSHPEYAICGR